MMKEYLWRFGSVGMSEKGTIILVYRPTVGQLRDLVGHCLTREIRVYTLRIDAGRGTKSHTKAAGLVASAARRSRWGHVKQHCAAGTRRDWYQGVFGTAYPPDRRASGAK